VPPDLLQVDEPSDVPLDLQADITRFGATHPGRGG
jgi:hypothetical protein